MSEQKGSGKVAAAAFGGALTALGIDKLINALSVKAAPPPGGVICIPDDDTRAAIAGILGLLSGISAKLDNLESIIDRLDEIKDLLGSLPGVEARYQLRITSLPENLVIPGKTDKELYKTTAPEIGSVVRVKVISDGQDIQYDIYLDGQRWPFSVADMVDQSLGHPHFPGAWIEKATGAQFSFVFSSGDSMQVRFWDSFRLVARTITTSSVTIFEGQVVEQIFKTS